MDKPCLADVLEWINKRLKQLKREGHTEWGEYKRLLHRKKIIEAQLKEESK